MKWAAATLATLATAVFFARFSPRSESDLPPGIEPAFARLRSRIGSPAPEFNFRLLSDDSEHRLSEFRGKTVLLDVWTTGCGPCWKAMPKLSDLQEFHGNRLAVVTVTAQDPKEVRQFAASRGITLPPLSAYTNRISWQRPRTYPLTILIDGWIPNMGWPLGILVDGDGRIQAVGRGTRAIDQIISSLGAEPVRPKTAT